MQDFLQTSNHHCSLPHLYSHCCDLTRNTTHTIQTAVTGNKHFYIYSELSLHMKKSSNFSHPKSRPIPVRLLRQNQLLSSKHNHDHRFLPLPRHTTLQTIQFTDLDYRSSFLAEQKLCFLSVYSRSPLDTKISQDTKLVKRFGVRKHIILHCRYTQGSYRSGRVKFKAIYQEIQGLKAERRRSNQ